ncbi:hypothetical protein Pmar_PMAR009148 [Perkinsus marinus ATCC 50983]|uniref:Uncharacterized protein n=1 Tax=Perkinsus marinus (strain ATCC 50983 / TXsc) TaxID=423536 RepID=C5KBK2_PERM5|nr:hypothetical protein Pmar_PMAR009148 [Perkinsus marinus ATCC 50983]EER18122.1 hypothetical protein Pmar_PMAR009148 [Perkinsus marinus ATCC 50983]|eukprot:XP_002786326.1 hypothetical protein Pmar_PMAR009148 [Perkinsus marinus ATCC 50983]
MPNVFISELRHSSLRQGVIIKNIEHLDVISLWFPPTGIEVIVFVPWKLSALAEKIGLELCLLDEDMAPYVILADQGRAMLLGKVKLGSTIFRVLRSEACHAILGVVSMCEMGITLFFKTDGVRGRLVKVSINKPDGHQIQLTAASAGDPDRLQYELSGIEDCDNSHLGNNHIFQIWSPPTELEHIGHATDLTKQLQTDCAPISKDGYAKTTKCRPVVDCRGVNKHLGVAGYPGATVAEIPERYQAQMGAL